MLYRINAKILIKRARFLTEELIVDLKSRVEEIINTKGVCIIAVIGSPGSGKSKLAAHIKRHGLFSVSEAGVFVVDDLRGPGGERYKRKDLRSLIPSVQEKLFLLFDYRAALYLPYANLGIILAVDEEERLRHLKKRSERGFRKYKKRFYSIPPIPFGFKAENLYVCSETLLSRLGVVNENML